MRLRVAADPAHPQPDAVLFAKLYDVGQDGSRVLPANAIAPFRVSGLPADGTPVEVTVTLPGIVRPIEGGHSLRLVEVAFGPPCLSLYFPVFLDCDLPDAFTRDYPEAGTASMGWRLRRWRLEFYDFNEP